MACRDEARAVPHHRSSNKRRKKRFEENKRKEKSIIMGSRKLKKRVKEVKRVLNDAHTSYLRVGTCCGRLHASWLRATELSAIYIYILVARLCVSVSAQTSLPLLCLLSLLVETMNGEGATRRRVILAHAYHCHDTYAGTPSYAHTHRQRPGERRQTAVMGRASSIVMAEAKRSCPCLACAPSPL